MFRRRLGTPGIGGQLYETQLISLLYLRAIHNDAIEEFHFASNVADIGAFGDICFKAKVKGHEKPVAVFIQARCSENKQHALTLDWATYIDSYLRIKKCFKRRNNDVLFKGTFDGTECFFVMYTNAKVDFSYGAVTSGLPSALNDVLDTGGAAQRANLSEAISRCLTRICVKDELTSLAERLAEVIMKNYKYDMLPPSPLDMREVVAPTQLLGRYHVLLAQQVLDVSELQPDGHRVASFRRDFFDTDDEYLILFKEALFVEIVERRTIPPHEIPELLSQFVTYPSEDTLSQVIGSVVTYRNGELNYDSRYTKLIDKQLYKYVFELKLNVITAMELAAKDILLHQQFLVPAAFGNRDLTIRGSDEKKKKRLNYLALKIIDLLDKCDSSKIVTIDDSLGSGFLQHSGGLASAVGNIFVLDDNTKLIKITDNRESLGAVAVMLYDRLYDEISDLHEYRFCLKGNWFPKLSFDDSSSEEDSVKDFLNKFLFYSHQANLENMIKSEIEDCQSDQPNYFQIKTDFILLQFFNKIQKWWQLVWAPYLTRDTERFWKVLSHVNEPLLSIINILFGNKISQYDYAFSEDAVRSLNLQEQHSSTVIITENTALTVVKVMQYLRKKQHVVLDLEYLVSLPTHDRNALYAELRDASTPQVVIFVCDHMQHTSSEKRTLAHIAGAIRHKKTIIITNHTSIEVLQYFPKVDITIHDKKLCLVDMTEESQKRLVGTATATFGVVEMKLDLLLTGWPGTESSVSSSETFGSYYLHVKTQPNKTAVTLYGVFSPQEPSDERRVEVAAHAATQSTVTKRAPIETFVFMDIRTCGPNAAAASLLAAPRRVYLDPDMEEPDDKLTLYLNLNEFNLNIYKMLEEFINRQQKPVCLVAHNGHSFDFIILKRELQNLGITLPDDILCADSLYAYYDILEFPDNVNMIYTGRAVRDIFFENNPKPKNSYKLWDVYDRVVKYPHVRPQHPENVNLMNMRISRKLAKRFLAWTDHYVYHQSTETKPAKCDSESRNWNVVVLELLQKKMEDEWFIL